MSARRLCFLGLAACLSLAAGELGNSGPVVLQSDFSQSGPIDRKVWQPRQKTQWEIRGGVLHGWESPIEHQRSQDHHQGLEPRLMIRELPQQYFAEFRFRISEGEYTPIGPFLEFGHHMARISFHPSGAVLTMGGLKDHVVIQEEPDFRLEPNRWYRVRSELVGDRLIVRFEGGPTFRAKHPMIAQEKDGLGFCGLRGGTMDIDDVVIRALAP